MSAVLPAYPAQPAEYRELQADANESFKLNVLRFAEADTTSSNVAASPVGEISFIIIDQDKFQAAIFGRVAGASEKENIEKTFIGLAKKWREETGTFSLTYQRYAHPSYQAILVLAGRDREKMISPILKELKARPDRWFEALKLVTQTNPAKNAKTFEETVSAWLSWGKSEGYIS